MMTPEILVMGEVLFDIYPPTDVAPAARQIGGAPFNFAVHFARHGGGAALLSAVGRDADGENACRILAENRVRGDYVAVSERPTGRCDVSALPDGSPAYRLCRDAAYFAIPAPEEQQLAAEHFDALYFGSLALTTPANRETAARLAASGRFPRILCDINLRDGFCDRDTLDFCCTHATVMKVNRSELDRLFGIYFQAEEDDGREARCAALCRRFGWELLIVTLDCDGAMVYRRADARAFYGPRPAGPVVSCVGGGDSFFAAFMYQYLVGRPLQECLCRAALVSDFVVAHREAIPAYSDALRQQIRA